MGALGMFTLDKLPDSMLGTASQPVFVTATTDATTAHTKGAWVEVLASAEKTYDGFHLVLGQTNVSSNNTAMLIDIGFGAASSEVVMVPDVMCGFRNARYPDGITVPLRVPKGTRISVRVQGVKLADTIQVAIRSCWRNPLGIRGGSLMPFDNYGADTSVSDSSIDLIKATNNTKSAYAEITGATVRPYQALLVGAGLQSVAASAPARQLFDFALGPAGAEVPFVQNMHLFGNSNEALWYELWRTVPIHVPAGSRIAARYQTNASGGDDFCVMALGVPY